MKPRVVFVTGGTGYMGSRLVPILVERGHQVYCLVRTGSESKLPSGCSAVSGDPLAVESFRKKVAPADTFVQLVGVSHPSPAKARQFRTVDLVSVQASVQAAVEAGIQHFVYVSVAQPAPVMKAYQEVRAKGEALLRSSGLRVTILRPWYVLGPGHRWPYALTPFYWVLNRISSTRATAQRLGLVTLPQMLNALVQAIENPPTLMRIVEVPEIRELNVQKGMEKTTPMIED